MSFSAGTFSINSSGQPVVSGTTISASVFNALTADLATGLSTCMLKDGTQTATAGIGFYAGTVSLPGIYFGTDTATGLYRIGLNNTGYSINGTKLLDLSAALLAVTGATTVSTTLGVTGATTLTGGLVLPGTAANITLGSNFISNGGTDAGFSLDASNNASLSGNVSLTGGSSTNFLDTADIDPVGNNADYGFRAGGGYLISQHNNTYTLSVGRKGTDGDVVDIRKGGVTVGTISVTTVATSYNTTSDSRLKINVRPINNSGSIIDALNPSIFDWKSGEKDSYGFIAQEAYAVFPQAVTKGDVLGDTVTQKWAMDSSKFMPIVIAEIKSIRARLSAAGIP